MFRDCAFPWVTFSCLLEKCLLISEGILNLILQPVAIYIYIHHKSSFIRNVLTILFLLMHLLVECFKAWPSCHVLLIFCDISWSAVVLSVFCVPCFCVSFGNPGHASLIEVRVFTLISKLFKVFTLFLLL